MKGKEQNTWLSVVTFLQLTVMATTGAIVNEFLKSEMNSTLLYISLSVGVVAAGFLIGIYISIFQQVKKRKK